MSQNAGFPGETRFPDRYKASSYRTYNSKLPDRYDSSLAIRLFEAHLMDEVVVRELGSEIPSLTVLDVGCATGRLLRTLADAGARTLAGTDLAPRILEEARAKLAPGEAQFELRPADCEDILPWESGTFDVVTLTGVFHHFYRPLRALSELGRVLRPGGRLILVDPCFFTPIRQIFNLFLLIHPHEGDCRFYTPGGTTTLLRENGWTAISSRRVNWCFYSVVARKGTDDPPVHRGAE